jgi:hypothetical protein
LAYRTAQAATNPGVRQGSGRRAAVLGAQLVVVLFGELDEHPGHFG